MTAAACPATPSTLPPLQPKGSKRSSGLNTIGRRNFSSLGLGQPLSRWSTRTSTASMTRERSLFFQLPNDVEKLTARRPRVVIVGAGFAGLACAQELERLGVHNAADITLLDRRDQLHVPAAWQFAWTGRASHGTRDLEQPPLAWPLERARLQHTRLWVRTAVTCIDCDCKALHIAPRDDERSHQDSGTEHSSPGPESCRSSETSGAHSDGTSGAASARPSVPQNQHAGPRILAYDFLVIATGLDTCRRVIPGLEDHSIDLIDGRKAALVRESLCSMQAGHVMVLLLRGPTSCQAMPFEYACLIDDMLRKRGVHGQFKVTVVTPARVAFGDRSVDVVFEHALEERGIRYVPAFTVRAHAMLNCFQHSPLVIKRPVLARLPCDPISGCTALVMRMFVVFSLVQAKSVHPKSNNTGVIVKGVRLTPRGERPEAFAADLLLTMGPQTVPRAVLRAGLANLQGFVPVDAVTHESHVEDIFCIGDACSVTPKGCTRPLPKTMDAARSMGISVRLP